MKTYDPSLPVDLVDRGRLVYPFFSRRTVDRRRRTVDRLGRLNMQPPVLHSGATLADERRQMPSRPAGERPSGENARHNGRVAVWRKLALESRERAALSVSGSAR